MQLKEKISQKNIINNKIELPKVSSASNLDLAPRYQKSAKQLHLDPNFIKTSPSFIILNQENFNSNIAYEKSLNNIIYIINGLKFPEWQRKINSIKNNSNIFIIIFGQNEIKKKEEDKIRNIVFNTLDDLDIYIKKQIHKIDNSKKDFEELLKEKMYYLDEKELNEIKNLIKKESKNSNMYHLILYLFNCANSGLFEFEFKGLFPDKEELKEAEKIRDIYIDKKIINIENNRNTNGKKEIKFQEYTKYIKNKNVTNKIFDSIIIPINIQHDVLKRLFFFYAKKFRFLLDKLKIEGMAEKKEIGFEPNNSLFSFSAIQTCGIWQSLNDPNKFHDNGIAVIYNLKGYFNHLNRNFRDIFTKENIEFCLKNNAVWEIVKECLEDISITLLTLCRIYNNREIEESISTFKDYFKINNCNFSKTSKLRFNLFVIMQSVYDKNNKEKIRKDLEDIEKGFSEINNKEGQLETLYAQIIMSNDDILINLKDIYEKKMEIILREIKKENVDKNFLYLFESKIKYKLIECEIIKKQYKMSDDVENIIKIFNEKGMKFYVIKTLLLISNFFGKNQKKGKT